MSAEEKVKKEKEDTKCATHQKPFTLFCEEPECKVSICVKCLTETHPQHKVADIESKAEQGKKILFEASQSAEHLSKKYADHIRQLDSAFEKLVTTRDMAKERLFEQEKFLITKIQKLTMQAQNKMWEHMREQIGRINEEEARFRKAEHDMNVLSQTLESVDTPAEILLKARTAVQNVIDISDTVKNAPLMNISAPQFIPGPTEYIQQLSIENLLGSIVELEVPVHPHHIEYGGRSLKLPVNWSSLGEIPPFLEYLPDISWDIEDKGEVKQICGLGDNLVVYTETQDKGSLAIYSTNGEKLCTADDGPYTRYDFPLLDLKAGGAVTDMTAVIPRNSNDVYLMTTHGDKDCVSGWDFNVKRIQRGDYYISALNINDDSGFANGCPEWICSPGQGVLYLVEGKSPHQKLQLLGVVAPEKNPRRSIQGQRKISLEKNEAMEIGIPEVTGLAFYKSHTNEDILVFKSSAFGGSVVAKRASGLQTLWHLDNVNVISVCPDPQRNLLHVFEHRQDGRAAIHVYQPSSCETDVGKIFMVFKQWTHLEEKIKGIMCYQNKLMGIVKKIFSGVNTIQIFKTRVAEW